MLLEDGEGRDRTALPVDGDAPAGLEPVLGHDRRVLAARGRLEAIAKAGVQCLGCGLVQVDVDRSSPRDKQPAQVVDAVGMIGMLMGEEHRVEPIDLGVEKLLAQVRRSIDQNASDAAPSRRSTSSDVRRRRFSGIVGVAGAPAERRARDAT